LQNSKKESEKMHTIQVDFDVFKAITARRESEAVTENDVLREILGFPRKEPTAPSAPTDTSHADWIVKGVRFPVGTEFRATHKGQTYTGRVEGGALVLNGKRYDSPSAAGIAVTKGNINGWRFWRARLPGQQSWKIIDSLRHSGG
jgi:hypothetical protein